MSTGKISFCLLLWQSITLMSSALNRTQAVKLCLFCDNRNRGKTPHAKHIFPDFFQSPQLFPDHCQIPWLFHVFQVGGRPVIDETTNINTLFITVLWRNRLIHILSYNQHISALIHRLRAGCYNLANVLLSLAMVGYRWKYPGLISVSALL